jgi:hypothetical protein
METNNYTRGDRHAIPQKPENESFDSNPNATRSKQSGRYDLISPHGIDALARRLKLGAERHSPRGWESGGEGFRQATISHLMAHLASYMENPNQDDTDAIICNAMFLCHFQAKRKISETGKD